MKQWLYRDDLKPVAELDGTGTLVSVFVYGSNPLTPDLVVRDNATYRLLTDHVGSVLRAINVSNGADVASAAEYTAFGEQSVTTGSADFVPFGFAGGLYDAQTGLVRFGARDYDPVVGRWTSKDRLIFDGGQANLYTYVGNDPINRIDPVGLASCWAQAAGAASAVGLTALACLTAETGVGVAGCVLGLGASAAAIDAALDACDLPPNSHPPGQPPTCGGPPDWSRNR